MRLGIIGVAFLFVLLASPVGAQTAREIARQIEAETGGRAGLAVLDMAGLPGPQWRADERFAMMSTFKPLACAAYLDRESRAADIQAHRLSAEDIVTYSPVMQERVGREISGAEACAAALRMSDNTAANILLDMIDGPAGLTAFLRVNGDEMTRLDRYETELNTARPGDPRDTTTPAALLASYQSLLLGEMIHPDARERVTDWMRQNQVSPRLLRLDAPPGWTIADRSGAGGYGSRAYIALIEIDGRSPILLTAFLTETELTIAERDIHLRRLALAALAELGI